jgi:hypothetical protein
MFADKDRKPKIAAIAEIAVIGKAKNQTQKPPMRGYLSGADA